MDDPGKVMIALGLFTSIAVSVRALAKVLIARSQAPRLGGDPLQAERLARIEQAVDAIALEVERISEGQRFTTKLLSERAAERPRVGDGSPRP